MSIENQLTRRQFVAKSAAAFAVAAVPLALPGLVHAQNETPAKKIRIGIAGGRFGAMFFWHEHPGCVVEAVSDLIPERRESLMKVYQCARSYPSLEEMVKDPNLDAIGVFTDGPKHFEHAMLALAHGKHVISATPAVMAATATEALDQAHKLSEKVKQTGLTYMMAETSLWQQRTISARKLYANGAFGQITYCESDYLHSGLRILFGTAEKPTWAYGLPPMFYPTQCTAHLVGMTRERLVEVTCTGWGDDDPVLKKNEFANNPFWNETALFRSDKGTPFRVRVWWEGPVGNGTTASWFGTKMSLNAQGDIWTLANAPANTTRQKPQPSRLKDKAWWKTDMLPESL
ncbi:MAG: Gfo/Idh/MocA family oxidoreductase, partial [Verrucomicrobia bacterium]|nr:Gfo/Idh/MocA family oxidoreductase [Verrucomicrobiota bacterium]